MSTVEIQGFPVLVMKKINIMLHTEVIECLRPLEDETLASIMRMIFDWNDGLEVKPVTQVEKFAWALVLPKLEKNKVTYEAKVKQTTEAANKRWNKQKDTNECERIRENPNYNYNYNYINSSKEELINTQQPSSPQGDEVVSKGLESLEKLFPQGRNYIGIDEVNLWNKLSQQEKQLMIKRGAMYIRNENKKDDGKYIKGIGKWMREQVEKGLEEKQPSMKNSTKSDDPRLLKMIDGNIYSILLSKVSNSTKAADKLYYLLNRKEMFTNKDEFSSFARNLNQQEINDLIN
jgi:hypothetical protein